jgi:hypothetical protein
MRTTCLSATASQQFALVRTFAAPAVKRQREMMRCARRGHCVSRTSDGIEQSPLAVLDLLIQIENDRTSGGVHEVGGQAHLRFMAARFA